jgi:peptidoglycan/LPS O-acetylase OafA/YrhL
MQGTNDGRLQYQKDQSYGENAPVPPWNQNGRIPCLDGLRGIAILLVLLCHVACDSHSSLPKEWVPYAVTVGKTGVDLFLVISGFLITLLLLRENQATGTISLKGFYRRRAIRILPAYFAFLAGVFCLNLMGLVEVNAKSWVAAATYTMNFLPGRSSVLEHLWSLSVEEHFYLVWPIVLWLVGLRRARWIAVGAVIGPPILRAALRHGASWHHLEFGFWTFTRMDALALGCCLALAPASLVKHCANVAQFSPRRATYLVLAQVCLFAAIQVFVMGFLSRYSWSIALTISESTTLVFYAALIWVCVHQPHNFLGRLLNMRPLAIVGLLSYSIYLWQQPFLVAPEADSLFRWPVNLCLALIAAVLSYTLIERPFLALKGGRQRKKDIPSISRIAIALPTNLEPTPTEEIGRTVA